MRWATGMLKPTQPRKCAGWAASRPRIADSYSSMPLPSITVCAAVGTNHLGHARKDAEMLTSLMTRHAPMNSADEQTWPH